MLSGHLGFQRKFKFETIMMEIYSVLSCSKKRYYLEGLLFVKLMTFPVVSRNRKLATAVRVVKCSRLHAKTTTSNFLHTRFVLSN